MSLFGSDKLKGKKIAIVATDGFEQVELTKPKKYLEDEGADVDVISLKSGSIKGWDMTDWGDKVDVDKTIDEVNAADYDALVLPGGQINPDKLRLEKSVVDFASEFMRSGKVVAAICHGPWTLIETGLVHGKTMTSWPSLKTDLKNAGAHWVDEEVVVDKGLITSRKPDDIPAFNKKIVEEILEGQHAPRS
ncbi:type 1 glutamine amidotransferase domain-containing protein [Hymenobacter sp. GOD-10R]|uniref:type 1 glutamine amidotransferase domain-containing protein n=1 Tax=Hymenobacter sp. GOD-10R TaxID=3093922 RepID=UPI002D7972B9|nr:type 1 glutamine amidotransferase domain-containing protein [Hymenobacter sp. GOD-10R]WRQ31297.1 type 1 glutamine amidotransferase domain-containing protein [Hymenobacter sp. GOD-10R]